MQTVENELNEKYEMYSTIWKIFAIGCAVAIKLPTTTTKNKAKRNETKQNKTKGKRQAAVISNHNNCSERRNKKINPREEGKETERETRC